MLGGAEICIIYQVQLVVLQWQLDSSQHRFFALDIQKVVDR